MAEERFHMMALGIVAAIVITASALYLADGTGIAVTGMATGEESNWPIWNPQEDGTYILGDEYKIKSYLTEPGDRTPRYAILEDGTIVKRREVGDSHVWERMSGEDKIKSYSQTEPGDRTPRYAILEDGTIVKRREVGDSHVWERMSGEEDEIKYVIFPEPESTEKTFNLKAQNVLSNVNNALQFGQGMWMLMGKSFREQKLFEVMGEIGEMLSARFWISEVCMGAFADVETGSGSGMLLGEVGGLPIPVVNVKGEKVPMQSPDPEDPSEIVTRYYYKIEWWATYPSGSRLSDHDAIRFDIYVFGPELHARINPDTIEVREGEERSATGTNMRYEGPTFKQYDSICLIFHHPIEDYDGKDLHRICDTFGVYGGDPTSVAVPEAAAAGAGSFDSGAFTD